VDTAILVRAVHVLGVVLWIGGVAAAHGLGDVTGGMG